MGFGEFRGIWVLGLTGCDRVLGLKGWVLEGFPFFLAGFWDFLQGLEVKGLWGFGVSQSRDNLLSDPKKSNFRAEDKSVVGPLQAGKCRERVLSKLTKCIFRAENNRVVKLLFKLTNAKPRFFLSTEMALKRLHERLSFSVFAKHEIMLLYSKGRFRA